LAARCLPSDLEQIISLIIECLLKGSFET
jgi:hypothetical protein